MEEMEKKILHAIPSAMLIIYICSISSVHIMIFYLTSDQLLLACLLYIV